MADDKLSIPASISGFGEILLSDAGTVAEGRPAAPFSISDLVARMQYLRANLDPAAHQRLLDMVESHILDTSLVHQIDPASIAGEILDNLSDLVFPGTVPASLPSRTIMAETVDLDDGVAYSRTGPMSVTDATGRLQSVPSDTLAIDYGVDGHPAIPIFPERTNAFTRSDVVTAFEYVPDDGTSRLRLHGSGTVAQTTTAGLAPDGTDRALIVSDDATPTDHGIRLSSVGANPSDAVVNVTSAFILPLNAEYVTCALVDDSAVLDLTEAYVTISLVTGNIVEKGSMIESAYIHTSPSGWLRIGVQYYIAGSSNIGMTISGHMDSGSVSYSGTGTPLFGVFGISTTHGAGLSPFIPTDDAEATVGPTTLSFSASGALQATKGIIALSWIGYRNTGRSIGAERGTNLLSLDGTPTLQLTNSQVKAIIGGASLAFTGTNGYHETQALSYTATKLKAQVTSAASTSVSQAITPLAGALDAIIGPAPGYFRNVVFYPVSDDGQAINYLVGETG